MTSFARRRRHFIAHTELEPVFSQNSGAGVRIQGVWGKSEGKLLRLWSRTMWGAEMLVGSWSAPHLRGHSDPRGLAWNTGILVVMVVLVLKSHALPGILDSGGVGTSGG